MSEPEISHRCSSCGASVRGHALFCPQCGHPLAQPRETSDRKHDGNQAVAGDGGAGTKGKAGPEPAIHKAADAKREIIPTQKAEIPPHETPTTAQNERAATNKSPTQLASQTGGQPGKASESRGRPGASTALAARKKIQQATTAARDKLEDNVRPRVEKIRQASSVVLEEATYDPSVRFILVAGVLFVLFIVLLILSKVI